MGSRVRTEAPPAGARAAKFLDDMRREAEAAAASGDILDPTWALAWIDLVSGALRAEE